MRLLEIQLKTLQTQVHGKQIRHRAESGELDPGVARQVYRPIGVLGLIDPPPSPK